ncbi:hypothetical protein NPIL_36151 [Nephila pilipes]|uniref:Uncharacterized protein n=1 Tax=Nephila pilipes TaxID=299642 RepID=A0A8X6MW56_NEPPI|nr:hypothetical protein NPIL_36151 [Nephila pilipes]
MEIPRVMAVGNNATLPPVAKGPSSRCVTSGQALQDGDVQPRPMVTSRLPNFRPSLPFDNCYKHDLWCCGTEEQHEMYKRSYIRSFPPSTDSVTKEDLSRTQKRHKEEGNRLPKNTSTNHISFVDF